MRWSHFPFSYILASQHSYAVHSMHCLVNITFTSSSLRFSSEVDYTIPSPTCMFVYVVCTNILLVEGERWWLPRIADEAILDTSRKMWGNWTKKFRWCTSQNLSTWLSSVGPGRPCDVDGRCGDGDNFAGGFENICFSLFEINCFCLSPKSPLSPIIYNFVNQSWISWAERSSWPRFLKPVTSTQKKLLKTLNPPTLSTIQTTHSVLIQSMCIDFGQCLFWWHRTFWSS